MVAMRSYLRSAGADEDHDNIDALEEITQVSLPERIKNRKAIKQISLPKLSRRQERRRKKTLRRLERSRKHLAKSRSTEEFIEKEEVDGAKRRMDNNNDFEVENELSTEIPLWERDMRGNSLPVWSTEKFSERVRTDRAKRRRMDSTDHRIETNRSGQFWISLRDPRVMSTPRFSKKYGKPT